MTWCKLYTRTSTANTNVFRASHVYMGHYNFYNAIFGRTLVCYHAIGELTH